MIFLETFRDLWRLLDLRHRAIAGGLVALLALSGALEIVGMFFLFGYIAALGDTGHGANLHLVQKIYATIGSGLDGMALICPLLGGPKSLLFWTTKEFGNGQETQAGGDHRQVA